MDNIALLGIPLYTLAKYRGMGAAVRTLRELGLPEALRKNATRFRDLGDVNLPSLEVDEGPGNTRNFQHFVRCSEAIYDAASRVSEDDLVFCLGGECGVIVGSLASFRTKFKGDPSLLWFDAHGDFNTPETTPSGFMGGMPLAFACGRGPNLTPRIDSQRPLLLERRVVHLGSRELDQAEAQAMQSSPMRMYSASKVKEQGMARVADDVANFLSNAADWIVCHLDIDVVDPSVMAAVNYPSKGGLTPEDIKTILERVRRTGKMKVFNLAAYNPLLDKEHKSAEIVLDIAKAVLS